uniref:Uncharacterized protein n=1 Tax=Setaria viridis TaxID=4556 RepID=A0A4U6TAC8_SETVI|nr:hypothetical protein SEVIR_8G006625v2 [Setaria viridis]
MGKKMFEALLLSRLLAWRVGSTFYMGKGATS